VFFKKSKEEVLEHTQENREEVSASETCGCLNCLSVFPSGDVKDWTPPEVISEETRDLGEEGAHGHRKSRAGQTALCPHCGEAMVLGDHSGHSISPASLDAMRLRMRVS
jgi:hypothetical protein